MYCLCLVSAVKHCRTHTCRTVGRPLKVCNYVAHASYTTEVVSVIARNCHSHQGMSIFWWCKRERTGNYQSQWVLCSLHMNVLKFMAIHKVDVEIFEFGPTWMNGNVCMFPQPYVQYENEGIMSSDCLHSMSISQEHLDSIASNLVPTSTGTYQWTE